MAYQIKLNVFEGPFDLLFHLIEKNEIDIYNIPIAQITEQYLDYIATMQMLDLEVASEFLVMAANLLAIKAKMLLPKHTDEDDEHVSSDDYTDPRDELVERLFEYRKFKGISDYLKHKEQAMSKVYTRPDDSEALICLFSEENPVEGISLRNLLDALKEVLSRVEDVEVPKEISRDEITIKDKMKEILRRLFFKRNGISFQGFFKYGSTREEVIITFLALLELIKVGRVKAFQSSTFGEITIYRNDKSCYETEGV